jgi:hypothetical protein
MTFAYFAANLSFIQHNFGLFTSIDPFNNVQVATYPQTPSPGKAFNTRVELLAIAALWGGGLWASLRLLRKGLLLRALPLLVLAISPFAVIFGQNYGGEASLRIILFSSAWWSALIAWAVATVARPRLRLALSASLALAFTAVFIPSFFGQEELNIVSAAEVRASEHFYYHARSGSVLVLAAPGFPFKYGGTYPQFRGPEGDAYPNLLSERIFQDRDLGSHDIPQVIARINQYSPYGYLAFTKDETAFAQVLRITPPGALAHLEAAVARSPRFRLWYSSRDARIYELVVGPWSGQPDVRTGVARIAQLARRSVALITRTLKRADRRARHRTRERHRRGASHTKRLYASAPNVSPRPEPAEPEPRASRLRR